MPFLEFALLRTRPTAQDQGHCEVMDELVLLAQGNRRIA
jgi:hypothetical protein